MTTTSSPLIEASSRPCRGCGEDNPATRGCPCGREYCGHCECDCADWHTVVHEDHEGDYVACQMPECVRLKAAEECICCTRTDTVSQCQAGCGEYYCEDDMETHGCEEDD